MPDVEVRIYQDGLVVEVQAEERRVYQIGVMVEVYEEEEPEVPETLFCQVM